MIYSHVGSSDIFLILALNDLQFLVLWLITLHSSLWRTDKPSSLNQISPTPLNKAPALLGSPSNVFEIDNHLWGRGGGGRVKRGFTVYEGNYATGMFARNKKVHSARLITESTNYYFLIEPITGWLLRPIFRLILTGYIYSRYMYDGIEHFYYAQSYESLYELWTAQRFKDIKTFTNKKVPRVHSN